VGADCIIHPTLSLPIQGGYRLTPHPTPLLTGEGVVRLEILLPWMGKVGKG